MLMTEHYNFKDTVLDSANTIDITNNITITAPKPTQYLIRRNHSTISNCIFSPIGYNRVL